ncbi:MULTISPECIES: hypothetical protein [Rhodobacterales]|uniref:hypothetical protein n=1 Tax=Rhodobacterales TaxID=204455 RepID=UPI00089D652B|nr:MULTISPECIES: hypothetical protein [Paracoccaceae]SEC67737.1 hypothetical protein SAMN05519105_3055 [Rhodobacter sp. 24-YEA-8]
MIHFGRHAARDMASALSLRFQPPQDITDSAGYLALFDRLARHDCPFVLYSDLRGFRLDHDGEVAQNQLAKASRAATAERIRGLVLVTDTPTERKRAAFSQFWSIPVEVYDDQSIAEAAFLALHDRLFADR